MVDSPFGSGAYSNTARTGFQLHAIAERCAFDKIAVKTLLLRYYIAF
jgi:hypothetical protein